MIRVIINADDFGLNPIVNQHIETAIEKGVISSTTILANTQYPEEVLRVYKKYNDRISFGVHLNLTQGESLTKSPVLRENGIIDLDGNFTKKIQNIQNYNSDLLNAIKCEWVSQISRIKGIGIEPSHLDGHHHVHGLIPLSDILIEVSKSFGISIVRSRYRKPAKWILRRFGNHSSKNTVSSIIETYVPKGTEKAKKAKASKNNYLTIAKSIIYNYFWRHKIKKANIVITDFFEQYSIMVNRLVEGYELPKEGKIELMCHPGHPAYASEEDAIMKNRLAAILQYSLISYNALK